MDFYTVRFDMDVMLTLGIGALTVVVGFVTTKLLGFNIEALISQVGIVTMIFPLFQMLFVYFTNPSGLMDWSNSYISMIVSQLPEEIIGELGGIVAHVLISRARSI